MWQRGISHNQSPAKTAAASPRRADARHYGRTVFALRRAQPGQERIDACGLCKQPESAFYFVNSKQGAGY